MSKVNMLEVEIASHPGISIKGGFFSKGSKVLVEDYIAKNLVRTKKATCEDLEKSKKDQKTKEAGRVKETKAKNAKEDKEAEEAKKLKIKKDAGNSGPNKGDK